MSTTSGVLVIAPALLCQRGDEGPGTRNRSLPPVQVSVDGRIGFVFQNPDHQVVMPTAGPDIALSLGGKGLTRDEVRAKVEKALADVNMEGFFDRCVYSSVSCT